MINSNLIASGLVFKMNLKRMVYLEEIKITPPINFLTYFLHDKNTE